MGHLPVTLLDLLCNSLILRQLAPYLPISSVLNLTTTCKAARNIVFSPELWQYLDLTSIKSVKIDSTPIDVGGVSWRAERMDESLTEDEFYSGPLRGIFRRLHSLGVLKHVRTLILDGLSVPADLVREIIMEDRYNVRILSIREAKNLNDMKLQSTLRYVVRPTRAAGTPKLKALYYFGPRGRERSTTDQRRLYPNEASNGVTTSVGAQIGAYMVAHSGGPLDLSLSDDEIRLYQSTGRSMAVPFSGWPQTMEACRGLIAFDAVLCRGPRHDITKVSSTQYLESSVATVALGPTGCGTCGSMPEGPAVWGESPESILPLLSPPPIHGSTVRAAQCPRLINKSAPRLILRCQDCLRGRWCERCQSWWCEDCYEAPVSRIHTRTQMQQTELREDLRRNGWDGVDEAAGQIRQQLKVYTNLCIEKCLVSEMMSGAGSNGMWG